jgi:hypothetical protein
MSEFAAELKNGNIVEQVIVGNYEWAIENVGGVWVDCTCGDKPCGSIGYVYDPETKTFSQPPPFVIPE